MYCKPCHYPYLLWHQPCFPHSESSLTTHEEPCWQFSDENADITEGQNHATLNPASSEAEHTDVIMIDSDDDDDCMLENVGDINQDSHICQYCHHSFTTESSLIYHTLIDHRIIIGNDDQFSDDLICWVCDYEIGSKEKLLDHLNNVHPQSADIPNEDLV